MSRNARYALVALSLALLCFPLTLGKPGLPPNLKADEPAYLLMGLSLARDHDLELDVADVNRLFEDFSFPPIKNLIVMSSDGWNTTYFSKPLPYPLFAMPFAALFGANGFLFFNMLVVTGMIWMGAYYLRRFNDDGIAVMFAAAFVLLSVGFSYGFWIHPETFNMGAIALACFGVFRQEERGRLRVPDWVWLVAAGAALALAVYNKPMYALLGLPLAWVAWRRVGWRGAGAWALGGIATALTVVALAVALQGRPSPYLGGQQRRSISVCAPGALPLEPIPPETLAPAAARKRRNWGYLLRIPDLSAAELLESIRDFLWGRHTGFLLYFPFGALCILLLALEAPRDGPRWGVLAALTGIALYFLVFMRQNYQGGGGFLGNRYFVGVYPAFLYLVRAVRPPALMLPAVASASLFLGTILLTPFGRTVPFPTLQSHVRNAPFRFFPLEFSLKSIPGYETEPIPGGRFIVRRDQIQRRGRMLLLRGGDRVEIWYEMSEPLRRPAFLVKNRAAGNRIAVKLNGRQHRLDDLGVDQAERVVFDEVEPTRRRRLGDHVSYIYKMVVTSSFGTIELQEHRGAARFCGERVGEEASVSTFFAGLEFGLLGETDVLDRDVYGIEWGEIEVPARVAAGTSFSLETIVTNRSPTRWDGAVAASLNFSYHWLDESGATVIRDGVRTPLRREIDSGETLHVEQQIQAPEQPGRYVLELDPVFENVAWFSERNGGVTYRRPVEVTAPE